MPEQREQDGEYIKQTCEDRGCIWDDSSDPKERSLKVRETKLLQAYKYHVVSFPLLLTSTHRTIKVLLR